MPRPDPPALSAGTATLPPFERSVAARIYRTAFPLLFALAAPGWMAKMLRRGGWREKFSERLGQYHPDVPVRNGGVLLHAVSVGEMFLALKLARAWSSGSNANPLTLATTTTTGMAQAAAAGFSVADRVYLPVDFPAAQRRMLAHFRPRLFASVEALPWPNLLLEGRRSGVRFAVLNARASPRSRRRYLAMRRHLAPMFAALDAVGLPEEEDLPFWAEMGVPENRLHVTGNIKFEVTPPDAGMVERLSSVLRRAGLGNRRPVLLGGSTFPGEERVLLGQHLALRGEFPGLLTILVPRHVERAPEVESEARRLGLRLMRRSNLDCQTSPIQTEALLVDVTGELRGWYALADAVFIGKSLLARGGQNPIEAVAADKRPIFGPNMENFQTVATRLLDEGLATRVRSAEELGGAIRSRLIPGGEPDVSSRAAKVLAPHRNATARTIELMESLLAGRP